MASSRDVTAAPGGKGIPSLDRKSPKRPLSDAMSMESAVEPRMGIPSRSNACDRLIAVWPPNCTMLAGYSGESDCSSNSFSRMSSMLSSSRGSK